MKILLYPFIFLLALVYAMIVLGETCLLFFLESQAGLAFFEAFELGRACVGRLERDWLRIRPQTFVLSGALFLVVLACGAGWLTYRRKLVFDFTWQNFGFAFYPAEHRFISLRAHWCDAYTFPANPQAKSLPVIIEVDEAGYATNWFLGRRIFPRLTWQNVDFSKAQFFRSQFAPPAPPLIQTNWQFFISATTNDAAGKVSINSNSAQ